MKSLEDTFWSKHLGFYEMNTVWHLIFDSWLWFLASIILEYPFQYLSCISDMYGFSFE